MELEHLHGGSMVGKRSSLGSLSRPHIHTYTSQPFAKHLYTLHPHPHPTHTRRHYADAARQGRIQARSRLPLVPLDAVSDPGLKKAFKAYCRVPIGVGRQVGASVQHLNAAQFNLLARDVGLVEPAGEWVEQGLVREAAGSGG